VKINARAFLILAVITAVVAALRFFMKGWLAPLGVSDAVGSFVASITVVLMVGMVIFFFREGRAVEGSYWRGVFWFALLTLWSECLIIAGILMTQRTGAATYYEEMMGKHLNMPPLEHALSHLIATVPVALVGALLGGLIYWIVKRGRRTGPSSASQA
jgi:hypothetical protein